MFLSRGREIFFLSVGQKKSFPPEGQKQSLPPEGQKKYLPPEGQKQSFPPSGQQSPTFGTKKIFGPSRGTKKLGFFTEKKKILKHFWAENNEKMSHWALAGKKTKSATLNKKVKRKMSTFSFFLSNFFSYSRNFFLKYIFISIFAFLSAGPFFLWVFILLFCYNFEVNRH